MFTLHRRLFFCLVTLLAGIVLGETTQERVKARQLSPAADATVVTLQGRVHDVPKRKSRYTRFFFHVDELSSSDVDITATKLYLSWSGPAASKLRAGQVWQLRVKLRSIKPITNPGTFDFPAWLFQQRVHASGYVLKSTENRLLSSRFTINSLREDLARRLTNQQIDSHNRGLMQGLLVGIRDQINNDTWALLRATGTSHLLAISGLHIGMLAMWGFLIGSITWSLLLFCHAQIAARFVGSNLPLYRLCSNRSAVAMCFSFIAATAYAALAGFTLPTQRALVMLVVVLILKLTRRHFDAYVSVSIALVLVLLIDPLAPMSAGFWLSFAAVLVLFSAGRSKTEGSNRWSKVARGAVRTHLIMGIMMFPITAVLFGQSSLVAPIANFFAIPYVGFLVVPVLMLWLITQTFSVALSAALLAWVDFTLDILVLSLQWLHQNIRSEITLGELSVFEFASILCTALIITMARIGHQRWLVLPLILPLAWAHVAPKDDTLHFMVLDTQDTISVVIRSADHTVVFSGSPKHNRQQKRISRALLGYLSSENIRDIDVLVLPEAELTSAVDLLHEHVTVRQILNPETLSKEQGDADQYSEYQWHHGATTYTVICETPSTETAASCHLYLQHGAKRIWVAGELDSVIGRKRASKYIQQRFEYWQSTQENAPDMLVAAPDVEKLDTTDVAKVAAEYLILGVTGESGGEFVHEVAQMRYKIRGAQTYSTDSRGAIEFSFSRDAVRAPAMQFGPQSGVVWR